MDLEEFLRQQGEKLIPSGPELRMSSDHSVTIRGNEWFDHATRKGGHAISFAQMRYGLSYPEAVQMLLNGNTGHCYPVTSARPAREPKPFSAPPVNTDLRRVYAYLMKHRQISRTVITAFVKAGVLYEDAEHHNVVFAGKDSQGVIRHAHKRSTNSTGKVFRINVEGSDPQYSFHHLGSDGKLYVFEAPIDLLSYITLYPQDWQKHSYVSCCGTSAIPVMTMVERMKHLQQVVLCLDNDPAGQEAAKRIAEQLQERFGITAELLVPKLKDWNDDLCAAQNMTAPICGMEMG